MFNIAFFKKELKEILRTYRLWVVPVIFIFIGLSSIASAKFLPEILKEQLKAQNIKIQIPEQTAVDAFVSYFKNLNQIGILAVILLTMGLVSEERVKGVLAQILTKPLKRTSVITSKFLVHGGFMILSAILGAIIAYLYTLGLFKQPDFNKFALANMLLLVYLLLVFTITLFFSALLENQILAGGLSLIAIFTLSILPSINRFFEKYAPSALLSLANETVKNVNKFNQAYVPVVVSVLLIVVLLAVAAFIFKRQEF